jgi:hypothetical protein
LKIERGTRFYVARFNNPLKLKPPGIYDAEEETRRGRIKNGEIKKPSYKVIVTCELIGIREEFTITMVKPKNTLKQIESFLSSHYGRIKQKILKFNSYDGRMLQDSRHFSFYQIEHNSVILLELLPGKTNPNSHFYPDP